MAVIQTGPIVSDIRGSVGAETFSRNQGGLYVRTRTGPGGEPTAKMIAVKDAMTDLSQAWSDTLTESQRETWRTYAAQFPRPNRWGKRTLTNGYNRFIGVNFNRYLDTDAIETTTAPTLPPLNKPAFTMTATTAPDEFTIPYPWLDHVNQADPLWVFAYLGTEQNPGVNFYASPFSFLERTTITMAAWKANPIVLTSAPAAFTTAKKIWLRLRIQSSLSFAISEPNQAWTIFDA